MGTEGRIVSTIAGERPVLSGRPSAELKLPNLHAELLALISAHGQRLQQALPWPSLLRYVDEVAYEGPKDLILDDSVRGRNPDRLVAELLGDLIDYGLIEAGRQGLAVTSVGTEALQQSDDRGLLDQMIEWIETLKDRPAGHRATR
jgi:hypothetical protein